MRIRNRILNKGSNILISHTFWACQLQIDPDPDPADHFDPDPDPTFQFDADPDLGPQHCLLASLEE
jgi:hypothetical protein